MTPLPARRPARARLFGLVFIALGISADFVAGKEPPTYSRDVEPILRSHCRECHRPDQVAPFSLLTYEQARKRAGDLASVAEERRMPPWKPTPGVGPKLLHDRSLSRQEIETLRAWADSGALRGSGGDLPPEPLLADGWKLGRPDVVLEPSEDFPIPASGPDIHRCFVIPTNLPGDSYVSAVEYRPGNARVVHHAMAFVETLGAGRRRDEAEPGPGYESYSGAGVEIFGDLGGWAPGNEPSRLPDGVGRSLPKGADVILQIHYHPDGKPEVDRSRIGLHLSRGPVRQTLQWKGVMSRDIRLEAGEADTKVKASWMVPVDVEALAVAPHMHQLGRSMKMTALIPGGRTIDLIQVDDWDPGWQGTYSFEKPVSLPKGTIVKVVAHYDNSPHPRNPSRPPRLVKWGQGSTDEMCVGYIAVVKARQDLTRPGEKDDLFPILLDQYRRQIRRELDASWRR
jgi:Copper type II ascorbate-dependent monooxygenase, C-terminal domain